MRFFRGVRLQPDIGRACCAAVLFLSASSVSRTDTFVPRGSEKLFVREVRTESASRVPVLLVHGGGGGGLASFDVDVPGYSLAEDLATAGHRVYVMDVRGWGQSSRPAALASTDPRTPPSVTSEDVVEDIASVVDWIRSKAGVRRVALLGHASGGHWAGMYAAGHGDVVSHLVMVNSMYGVKAPWRLTAAMQDPQNPGVFNPNAGACRVADAAALLANWNANIPDENKAVWRDPRVADAYVRATIDPDPSAKTRTPPAACIPRGFQRDHFEMAQGKVFWQARDVRAATLVIRGSRDHWSRAEDLTALRSGLTNAERVEVLEIPEATHFVLLDRPERGRQIFVDRVRRFLAVSSE
jgi:pimeloyl-ACP methyl ester carboxylesterase